MHYHGGDAMSSMHDNGRGVDQSDNDGESDLCSIIDHAGAAASAALSLAHIAAAMSAAHDGVDVNVYAAMLSVASDAREASFYLRRAVVQLRGLL